MYVKCVWIYHPLLIPSTPLKAPLRPFSGAHALQTKTQNKPKKKEIKDKYERSKEKYARHIFLSLLYAVVLN